MKVKDLIENLKQFDPEDVVMCQVVEEDSPHAWNMFFDLKDIPLTKWVQLRVFHPELKKLPQIHNNNNKESDNVYQSEDSNREGVDQGD